MFELPVPWMPYTNGFKVLVRDQFREPVAATLRGIRSQLLPDVLPLINPILADRLMVMLRQFNPDSFMIDGYGEEKERWRMTWPAMDLDEELNDLVTMIRAEGVRAGVQVTMEASAQLPAPAEPEHSSSPAGKQSRAQRKLEWEAKALLLLQKHPEWTNKRIAEFVGVSGSALSRSKQFQAARRLAVSGEPRAGLPTRAPDADDDDRGAVEHVAIDDSFDPYRAVDEQSAEEADFDDEIDAEEF